MSNPVRDERGEMLISCHSLNRTDYQYNNGCVGYACDETSLIAFTVANPDNPELLNNRKLSRFVLFFDPDDGFLVQSRLYDTKGGTEGEQEMADVYLKIVLKEFASIMGIENDWNIDTVYDGYGEGNLDYIEADDNFGGYQDWTHSSFNARICFPVAHKNFGHFIPIKVGSAGLCVHCGSPISSYLVCEECDDYHECESCGECFHENEMSETGDGDWYCEDCADRRCKNCADCGDLYHEDNLYDACDADGNSIEVCSSCRDYGYTLCELCATYTADEIVERTGDGYDACPSCRENKCSQCGDCGRYFYRQNLVGVWDDGDLRDVCEDCAEEYESEEKDEEYDQFADGE